MAAGTLVTHAGSCGLAAAWPALAIAYSRTPAHAGWRPPGRRALSLCKFAPTDEETPCPARTARVDSSAMRRRHRSSEDLRIAVDCLPAETRVAMLEGIRRWPIIVGAYTDRRGGVCPMLAAHRCGGRTDFLPLSRAGDRFTRAQRPRPPPQREVGTLVAHLEASLLGDPASDFGAAIADHKATARQRREREAARVGWSWLWRPSKADGG